MTKSQFQHQKDLNGCGIACMANLLNTTYDDVKKDFEIKFYTIERGVQIADIVRYLETHELKYKSKFFNQKSDEKIAEGHEFSKIEGAITLIAKSSKYPIGHYLLKTKDGWIDPWYNLPSIDNVHAGLRKALPGNPWYVLYSEAKFD